MVLSGTLKEFILADVFNLLAQQRITGKLVLTCDKREGGILFRDGEVVGAECGEENLPNKLFNYLSDIKKKTPEELTPVFNSHAGNLNALCSEAVEKGFLQYKELTSFASACVEDICCSLLTWSQGAYRFNSQRSVASQSCNSVKISVENIIMEGMRRADEWARMQEYIKEEMIFVPAKKGAEPEEEIDPATMPEEYVLTLLDGSCTVGSIVKGGCLCEYKVYESINTLLQSQRITALHQKYTLSIQAALKRKDAEEASGLGNTLVGSMIAGSVAAACVVLFLFTRLVLMPDFGGGDKDGEPARVTNAAESAQLLHHSISGETAMTDGTIDLTALKEAGLLTKKDFAK